MTRINGSCLEMSLLIDALVAGELDRDKKQELDQHLEECESCCRQAEETPKLVEGLRGLGRHSVASTSIANALVSLWIVRTERGAISDPQPLDNLGPGASRALPSSALGESVSEEMRSLACRAALERAYSRRAEEPHDGVRIAEVGVRLAEELEGRALGPLQTSDLRANAWAVLGNARRTVGDFRGARIAFSFARRRQEEGTGDERLEARLLELESALLGEWHDFEAADSLLRKAVEIRENLGDENKLCDSIFKRATTLMMAGSLSESIELFKKADSMVCSETDRRVVLGIRHNTVLTSLLLGRVDEALRALPALRLAHMEMADELDLVRLNWLEARVLSEAGELASAEERLNLVREAIVNKSLAVDAALVGLDLAIVYLKQGRFQDLKSLALQVLSICTEVGIHQEAIASLVLFKRAAESEKLSLQLIKEVYSYLEKGQCDSGGRLA